MPRRVPEFAARREVQTEAFGLSAKEVESLSRSPRELLSGIPAAVDRRAVTGLSSITQLPGARTSCGRGR